MQGLMRGLVGEWVSGAVEASGEMCGQMKVGA